MKYKARCKERVGCLASCSVSIEAQGERTSIELECDGCVAFQVQNDSAGAFKDKGHRNTRSPVVSRLLAWGIPLQDCFGACRENGTCFQ